MNKRAYNTLIIFSFLISASHHLIIKPNAVTSFDSKIVSIKNEMDINGISFVDFVFTDLYGTLYEITLPSKGVVSAFKNGLKFDGSSIPGCSNINSSDMHLDPDLDTFEIVPFTHNGSKSARVMCHVCRSKGAPHAEHPREILKQAMREMYNLGYQLNVGAELEFFLFDASSNNLIPSDTQKYCQADLNLQSWINKKTLMLLLLEQGIDAEKIHHEVAPGQYEIVLHYNNPLVMADQIVKAKHSIKVVAQQMGLQASFMPKPIAGENGSAMHVHFSMSDRETGKNVFYNPDDTSCLSPIAKQFIAGVLHRVRESAALLNPTINSYKRLVPGYEAPVYICWGNKNRSSLIRIPTINDDQPEAARAEIRSPDPSSNPYLVFAFLIYAGLEGIKNQTKITDPASENLYKLTQERINELGIKILPKSLSQAVNACGESTFMREVFGDRFIDLFLNRQQIEITNFQHAITDWELKRYIEQ